MTEANDARSAPIAHRHPAPPVVDPDQITPAWMTQALRAAGLDVELASLEVAPVGVGQVGETYRYRLSYEGVPPADAPASLIGKFHSSNADSRSIAGHLNLYRQEFMFYREVAASARIKVPKPYLVLNDGDDRFILLLEDFAPARPADHLTGITVDQARLAVLEAAKLHASHWGDPDLARSPWLKSADLAQGVARPSDLIPLWPSFRERYGALIAPDRLAAAEAFIEHCEAWNRPRPTPRSITHNDFRADNFLFGSDEGGPAIGIVDWQTVTFNYGVLDLAYLIGGAFEGEARRAAEKELLPLYFDALREQGVTGYDEPQFRADYRHFTFAGLTVTIIAAMTVMRTERGDRLFLSMFDRHASHALDHDAVGLLRS